jgi:hypothetical protein
MTFRMLADGGGKERNGANFRLTTHRGRFRPSFLHSACDTPVHLTRRWILCVGRKIQKPTSEHSLSSPKGCLGAPASVLGDSTTSPVSSRMPSFRLQPSLVP